MRPRGCEQTTAPGITCCAGTEAGNSQLWYRSRDEARTSNPSLTALLWQLFIAQQWEIMKFLSHLNQVNSTYQTSFGIGIQSYKRHYFYVASSQKPPNWMSSSVKYFLFSCVFGKMYDLMSSLSVHLYSLQSWSQTLKRLTQKKYNSRESNLAANEGFSKKGLLCSQLLQRERQMQCPCCPINDILTLEELGWERNLGLQVH